MIEERLVTIEDIEHPNAVVRDQRGATFEVPTSILLTRGKVPRVGEQWLVTRDWLSGWRWVGYIDVTGQGGSSYREVIGDGNTSTFTITHGLGTLVIVVQVQLLVDGEWVVNHDPAVTIESPTQVRVDFGASPPAQGEAAVVVMSV